MAETAFLERGTESSAALRLGGPLRPWSLWELLHAYAAAFHKIAQWFDAYAEELEKSGNGAIPAAVLSQLLDQNIGLPYARSWVGTLHMTRSMELAYELEMRLTHEPERVTASAAKTWLDALTVVIERELGDRFLYFVPDALPGLCFNPRDKWGEAPKKFTKSATDIDEASYCLALGRPTASVFHLMRALEYCLIILAREVGVPQPPPEGWHRLIEAIEAYVKRMSLPRDHRDYIAKSQQERQFYAEEAQQFRYFKDAYRDYVTHTARFYAQPEARGIYDRVSEFTAHLATRLAE